MKLHFEFILIVFFAAQAGGNPALPPCPNLLSSGSEFDGMVREAVAFLENPISEGNGFRRFLLSPPPLPEISPRTETGVPCLYTPRYIGAINRSIDSRHPAVASQALGRIQILTGLPVERVYIVTHALGRVEGIISEFLMQKKRGPTLTLASPIFTVPTPMWNVSSLVRYSSWGELPSSITFRTGEFHLLGGSGIGCQLTTTWDLMARLTSRGIPAPSTPPKIVVHTGLTYASDEHAAGPLLRDYMRNVAGHSFRTYVEKVYPPANGYQVEMGYEEPSGLGDFYLVNGSGRKIRIEYVYP